MRFGTSMSARHILGLEKVPRVGLFATMLCLSAETEAVRRDTPMCEERQTHSDRILPGLTSPIRSAMRETATSFLSLKRRLTCYRSSAFIRRTGRQGAILPWEMCIRDRYHIQLFHSTKKYEKTWIKENRFYYHPCKFKIVARLI